MFQRNSRYARSRPFEPDPVLGEVFRGVRPREIGPATGVLEHVIRVGDRLDLLARYYYNDSRLGWRILDANPELLFGGDISLASFEGRVLLIPRAEE
jgi:hypothetical protein